MLKSFILVLFVVACQDYKTPTPAPSTPQTIVITEQKSQDATVALDGAALYAKNCEKCHNPLAVSEKGGVTGAAIYAAIGAVAEMSGLQALSLNEISSIATALSTIAAKTTTVAADDDGDDDDDDDDEDDDD